MTTSLKPRSRAETVQIVTSPGGLTAWLVEDYAVPLIAFDFAFKGGAAQDAADTCGAAAMLAGLLDEGAGDLDSAAFQGALDDKAIEISFGADRDVFSGAMKTLTRARAEAFKLLALAVGHARLDPAPLERVRGQMLASLRRQAKDPDAMASKAFRECAYPDHPYGRPVRGAAETLAAITRDDLAAVAKAQLARDSVKIAVVGAISAGELAERLDEVFGALPAHAQLTPVADVTLTGMGAPRVQHLDLEQSTIRFGRPGIARHDPDFMTATVVNHILGGGVFSARLFREVREKRGLAYSVYSQLGTQDHTAFFSGGTSTKNERAAESLSVIKSEIDALAADGPTQDELDKAKKYLIGSYALRFDTSTKIASQLVNLQTEGLGVDYLDQRNELVAAVTMDEARRVGARLFGDGALLVTVAGAPIGM